jgi:ribosomal protein S18 acetylase RimI-like enzyme
MRVKLRNTTKNDLDKIYELHTKCFSREDQWYKYIIKNYLDNGYVIETTDNNEIIAVLLQGDIIPCNRKLFEEANDNYKPDEFVPVNDYGEYFNDYKLYYKPCKGITMICVNPEYRKKGLAKKLINQHFKENINNIVCLNTRCSNIEAYNLYKSLGYEHIGIIKNKYILPDEDSFFMIKKL